MRTAVNFPSFSAITVFIVGSQNEAGSPLTDNNGYWFSNGASNAFLLRSSTNDTVDAQVFLYTTQTAAVANATFKTIRMRFEPSVSQTLAINNTIIQTQGVAGGFYAADKLNIFSDEAGANFGNKQIAEMIIFTRALTPTEITSVEDYLKTKYAHY